ncbi:MAG: PEP-CTERM sorting domain-containing protein, partial [Terriglobales bacterium]
ITGWTVQLFSDNGGQPGGLLQSLHVAGTGNETFDGSFGGFPAYTYSIALPDWALTAGTQYWISVYPDLAFPPQWGWSSGTGGDGLSYQDFFGARSPLAVDMAFALDGTTGPPTPEPSSLMLLGAGLLGFASKLRRK